MVRIGCCCCRAAGSGDLHARCGVAVDVGTVPTRWAATSLPLRRDPQHVGSSDCRPTWHSGHVGRLKGERNHHSSLPLRSLYGERNFGVHRAESLGSCLYSLNGDHLPEPDPGIPSLLGPVTARRKMSDLSVSFPRRCRIFCHPPVKLDKMKSSVLVSSSPQ